MIQSQEISASTPCPAGKRNGNWVNNWSSLHEEASIKYWQQGVQGDSRLANTSTQGRWRLQTPQEWKLLHSGPSQTSSSDCSLYSFSYPLTHWCFPECGEHSRKLIEPRRGCSLEPLIYSWLVRSTGCITWGFNWPLKREWRVGAGAAVLWDRALLWDLMLSPAKWYQY